MPNETIFTHTAEKCELQVLFFVQTVPFQQDYISFKIVSVDCELRPAPY